MRSLEHPDFLHLQAAQGWLELGDRLEANEELEKISPSLRIHPDVLLLRYQVFSKANKWEAAFYVAQALVEIVPKEVSGWINQPVALRKMPLGGAKAAWNALLPAADKFPGNPIIPYNLACYACQLGRPKEAWGGLLGLSRSGMLMNLNCGPWMNLISKPCGWKLGRLIRLIK